MADTQHNLKIKATLDASQLQQDIDRLNGQKPVGGGASGSARSTSSLLSKLDSTLSKLNATISRLAEVVRRPLASDNSGYILAKTFDQMTDREFADAMRKIDKRRPDIMTKVLSDIGLSKQELQVLQARGIVSGNTIEKVNPAASLAQEMRKTEARLKAYQNAKMLNPPIVSQNVMRVFPDGSYQLMDRDETLQQNVSQREPSVNNASKQKSWYRQVRLGWGLNMAGQIFGESAGLMNADEATQRSWQGVGNVISTAGMATMVHPIVGAFAFVATSALELAKSLKAAEEQVKVHAQRRGEAMEAARGGLNAYMAEKGVLESPKYEQLVENARNNILLDTEKRADAYRELIKMRGKPYSRENVEAVEMTQNYIKVLDNNIKENERIIEVAKRRREVLEEEVLAGQQLARAEIEFARNLRLDEELQANHDLLVKEEQFRENENRLTEYSRQRSMMQLSFDTEQSLAQIRLGMWNKSTAAEWFSRAAGFRNTITNLMNQASNSEDANEVERIHRDISDMRQQMFSALTIANALKDPGMRPERVDLQGLTSLAGRGGWMGEQYRQPEYMSTLDKMYDTLKSIDDNTRAAEKSVWQ